MKAEMEVKLIETQKAIQMQVQQGAMLPERAELELRKARDEMDTQLQMAEQEAMAKLQEATSKTENSVIPKKEFDKLMKNKEFVANLINAVPYHTTRIKQTCVVGDTLLYENKRLSNYTISL